MYRMSFLWRQRTQQEKEQKKNLEDVNQLLLESILPTKVSKYYMEEDRNVVWNPALYTITVAWNEDLIFTHTHTHSYFCCTGLFFGEL